MKGSGELEIARDIAKRLSSDFDCYVALNEQTVLGLRENIFEQLKKSEYFLFIDFKREQLIKAGRWPLLKAFYSSRTRYRGSLFTHQELGIASFLEIDSMAFHEAGIDERDGMRGVMQLNSNLFTDRNTLAAVVEGEIRKKWSSGWKRTIDIETAPTSPSDAHQGDITGPVLRHFHLAVRNRHKWKTAEDCRVFPIAFEDVGAGKTVTYEPVEVKWAGSIIPSIPILPLQLRRFDAFQVAHLAPHQLIFKGFSDSTEFRPQITKPGTYRITYLAISRNLGEAQKVIEINATGILGTISMKGL